MKKVFVFGLCLAASIAFGQFMFGPNGQAFQCLPVVSGGGGATPFITSQTLGTPISFSGRQWGFKVSILTNCTVTDIGRFVISGNSDSHTLRVWAADGSTVLASVVVNCSGATPGGYLYGTLSSPLSLSSGNNYYFTSDESGTDSFYDQDTTVTGTAIGNNIVSCFNISGTMFLQNADTSYIPVNFKYTIP